MVAIVGSGPSGFYVAKYLLKSWPEARVDMIEQYPTPHGLVRYGVAPDHPEVKAVEKDFSKVASSSNFRFFGNVLVGGDGEAECRVSVESLRRNYDSVVLACGAGAERKLGIPGEDLEGVVSARKFVAWYNSEPKHTDLEPFFERRETSLDAVVVGHGNVALDCARILATKPENLVETDIARKTLEHLKRFDKKKVSVVGRRGPAQAAFTIKELRELTHIDGAPLSIFKDEVQKAETPTSLAEIESSRALKRKLELLTKFIVNERNNNERDYGVSLRFLLKPIEFKARQSNPKQVGSVLFEKCLLSGDVPGQQRSEGTGTFLELPCDLALLAVGYLAEPPALEGSGPKSKPIPFLPNVNGRVGDFLYTAGWLKRGPSGIIGSNIADARDTVQTMLNDLGPLSFGEKQGISNLEDHTTWEDWQAIDEAERKSGEPLGAPRLKFPDVHAMLQVIRKQ